MRTAVRMLLIALWIAGSAVLAAGPAAPSNDARFKLKPGARGKACVECHADFQDTLALPFVHTPVKSGACVACHEPHASSHGKMLAADTNTICRTCHDSLIPKAVKSVHAAAVEGKCIACHDPHGSKNRNNLVRAGNELCLTCHKTLGEAAASAAFKHAPVQKDCLTCHDPHASASADHLLRKNVAALCTTCHKPDAPAFVKDHGGYPVAKGRCTSCHDPHGSPNRGILWASVHPPVASRQCAQCHMDASSPDALKTKKRGVETCRTCHSELVNTMLASKRLHDPVADRVACLNCHNPHAARVKPLLLAPMKALCGSCHVDTIRRQEKSATPHPPVADGDCTSCHQPHGSDNTFLLTAPTQFEVCGNCHDWKGHSAHPIGAKAADPRNKNLTLDCSSCHRTHGTTNKHFTHFDSKTELCVQCHQTFVR